MVHIFVTHWSLSTVAVVKALLLCKCLRQQAVLLGVLAYAGLHDTVRHSTYQVPRPMKQVASSVLCNWLL